MNNLVKISVLLLAFTFPLNAIGKADASSDNGIAEIQPVEKNRSASAYPASQPIVFQIYTKGASGVTILSRVPSPNSIKDSQNDTFRDLVIEWVIQTRAKIYLLNSNTIDRSSAVKKLIFPFHSHW